MWPVNVSVCMHSQARLEMPKFDLRSTSAVFLLVKNTHVFSLKIDPLVSLQMPLVLTGIIMCFNLTDPRLGARSTHYL